MFEIEPYRIIDSDLPIITANYLELLADENPILYSGTNKYGNRILGIIIEESEDDFSIRNFHVIIDDEAYYKFINKVLTLRKVIENSINVFIIDFKGTSIRQRYLVPVNEIPEEYLPLDDSYCPDVVFSASFNFGVSLKGKKAELHLADVLEVNNMQTTFDKILKDACSILQEDLEFNPKTYLEPSEVGSFRVNYRIEFDGLQASLFPTENNAIAEYISSFLTYIVSRLPQENNDALKEESISSQPFKDLEDKLAKLFDSTYHTYNEGELKHKLSQNINKSALKFEDITNQIINSSSFDKIELLNYQTTGAETGLGLIDRSFFESIKPKLITNESAVVTEVIEEDLIPQTYRIRVYHLNTETANCWAYFYPDDTETNWKIPIRINRGDKEISNSIYSKSLDEKKVENITGIGERINGRISSIYVEL